MKKHYKKIVVAIIILFATFSVIYAIHISFERKKTHIEAQQTDLSNTINKFPDTNKLANLYNITELYNGGIKDNFIVESYKNALIIWSDDVQLSGNHAEEALFAIEKSTGNQLWRIEANAPAWPVVSYSIDYSSGYCYVYSNYSLKCIEITTGKEIWVNGSNDFIGSSGEIALIGGNVFLHLARDGMILIFDSKTGKVNNSVKVEDNSYMSGNTKPLKFCALFSEKENCIGFLNPSGKLIKRISGRYYYFNDYALISVDDSSENNEKHYTYINLGESLDEITITANSESSLYFINSEYLILHEKDKARLFSIRENDFLWDKEMERFHSSFIYKNNIYMFGDRIMSIQLSSGNKNWIISPSYLSNNSKGIIVANKLFYYNWQPYVDTRGRYSVYDLKTGRYLYQISDYFPMISLNRPYVSSIYSKNNEIYFSSGLHIFKLSEWQ